MYLPYTFKELTRRRTRTATHIIIVAVVAIILITITTIMNAYSSAIYLPFTSSGSDLILQKTGNSSAGPASIQTPFGRGEFTKEDITSVAALHSVKNLSASLILWSFDKGRFVSIEGITPGSFTSERLSSWIKEGSFITNAKDKSIVVESHFANFNHLKTGDTLVIKNEIYQIAGIIKIKEGSEVFASNIYMPIAEAQALSGINSSNQIYLRINHLSNEAHVKSAILTLNKGIIALSTNSISAALANVVSVYNEFYWAGLGLIILIAVLILFKINAANLLGRKKDIAVLQSVGWTKRDIAREIALETFLQTIAGFILGTAASMTILGILGAITIRVDAVLTSTTAITIPLQLSAFVVLSYFFVLLLTSLIVAFMSTRVISSQKPSENLRSL